MLSRGNTRLSRRSRTATAIVALAAAFWMIWVFGINAPHFEEPKSAPAAERGIGHRAGELKSGEEIVIVRVAESGPPRELRLRPTPEGGPTLILSELAWETRSTTKLVRVLEARELPLEQANGLDAVLAFLRRQPRVPTRVQRVTLRIEHLRNGSVVGREMLEEPPLLQELAALRQQASTDAESLRRFENAVRDAGLSPTDVRKWVTPEMLLAEEIR